MLQYNNSCHTPYHITAMCKCTLYTGTYIIRTFLSTRIHTYVQTLLLLTFFILCYNLRWHMFKMCVT